MSYGSAIGKSQHITNCVSDAIAYSKPDCLAIFFTKHEPLSFTLHIPKC